MERIPDFLPMRLLRMVLLMVLFSLFGCGGEPVSTDPGNGPETGAENAATTDGTGATNDPSTRAAENVESPATDPTEPAAADPLAPFNPPAIQPAIVTPSDGAPDPIPLGGPVDPQVPGTIEASTAGPYSSDASSQGEIGGMSIDAPPPIIAPPIQAEN